MAKESLIFYKDWRDMLYALPNEFFEEMTRAILDYGIDGIEREYSPMVDVAMRLIKPHIDRNNDKFFKSVERSRINGAKGGRPKKEEIQNPDGNPKPSGFQVKIQNPDGNPKPSGFQVKTQNPDGNPKPVNVNLRGTENLSETIEEPNGSLSAAADEEINYQGLVGYYNKICESCNLVKCLKLTGKRKNAIRARIKEFGKHDVAKAIQIAAKSKFLNGHNDNNWRADFEFIFNANKMARILEGKYNDDYGNNTGNYNTIPQGQQARRDDATERINRLLSESDAKMARKQEEAANGLQPQRSEADLFK